MKPFAALVVGTLRQQLGGRRLLLLLLLGLVPAAVLGVLLADQQTAIAARQSFHEAPLVILFFVVLPVASLVFGSGALGDERRDATISFILLRPLPRAVVAAAKLLGAWLAAFGVVGAGAAAMAVVLGVRSGDWAPLGPLLLGAALSCLAYVSVFLVLGYLTARAVLVGLLYVFVWESGMTGAIPSLASVSLMRIGLSAYAGLVPIGRVYVEDILGVVQPGAGGAALKAAVVAIAAVGVMTLLLRHRDIA
ncbi:MAG: ABC transporter permease [Acidimicrobiia bacterium]|nr:ABC transporter permease [Acidimicrobiia bacterium]